MARAWPVPPVGSTIHHISDPHFGANTAGRAAKVVADLLESPLAASVAGHVITGDLVDTATPAQDTAYRTWEALLPYDAWPALGNHDLWQVRTAQEAADDLGLPGVNYTADLPFGKLLVIGPDAIEGPELKTVGAAEMLYGGTAIPWLDTALAAANGAPCVIACHAPLQGTVGIAPGIPSFPADSTFFSCQPDAQVREVLADYPNVRIWLSGHTHSPLTATDLVMAETIGGHKIAHINAGSIYYVGTNDAGQVARSPMHSMFVTYLDENTIEVRFRNHGARCWDGPPATGRVATIDLT